MPLGPRQLGPSFGMLPFPANATPLYQSAVGVSPGAVATATLSPVNVTGTVYLTQAFLTCTSPAAQQAGLATISDGTWTLNFEFVESTSAGGCLMLAFGAQPLMASAPNTAITVTVPVIGSGGTVAVAITGYQL
jgi:hypothetical protein